MEDLVSLHQQGPTPSPESGRHFSGVLCKTQVERGMPAAMSQALCSWSPRFSGQISPRWTSSPPTLVPKPLTCSYFLLLKSCLSLPH